MLSKARLCRESCTHMHTMHIITFKHKFSTENIKLV
uniref:Uncharacterized protein n=1 Tax=Rhizophora mucronata TaxID=61149 RepID=A0A2P2QAM9_RHIMU